MRRSRYVLLVTAVLVIGVALRVAWPDDIHYLNDEAWTFRHVLSALRGEGWGSLGMPSSRGVANPPMSVWVFIVLGRVTGASSPPGLTRAVALFALTGHAASLLAPRWAIRDEAQRRTFVWAAALATVNPILVFLERKIWAQSVLPLFMIVLLFGWMRRDTRVGAFIWGLLGAVIGQIHMAGFFFAAALTIWTRFFGARRAVRPRFGAWLAGSVIGILPAVTWLAYLPHARTYATQASSLSRFRFAFYQYFLSDPTGLSSEYVVGADLRDAMAWPIVFGHATWLVLAAHVVLGVTAVVLVKRTIDALRDNRRRLAALLRGQGNDTVLLLAATLVGMGGLMTLAGLPIYRHYMLATFPLEYVLVAQIMLRKPRGERWLAVLFGASTIATFGLLTFVHDVGKNAEMGKTYATQLREGIRPEDARK